MLIQFSYHKNFKYLILFTLKQLCFLCGLKISSVTHKQSAVDGQVFAGDK